MKYLFYVRFSLSGLKAFEVETPDPLHTMGEIVYRSIEHIERITFKEDNPASREYLNENNIKVWEWRDKYKTNKEETP